jgi:hypothetical protein
VKRPNVLNKAGKAARARVLAGIGGFLAAGLSLGLSIFESRNPGEIAHALPGTRINADRWGVTLHAATVATTMPNGSRLTPGKRAVVVNLTIENLTSQSSNLYGEALALANITGASRPQFFLDRDQEILWDLQPAMPEEVNAVWEVPMTQALPASLDVTVIGAVFKRADNLYAAPGWFTGSAVAQVDLPIAENGTGAMTRDTR